MSNNIYDILKKMQGLEAPKQTLTEGKKAKPDYIDIDKDGNKTEGKLLKAEAECITLLETKKEKGKKGADHTCQKEVKQFRDLLSTNAFHQQHRH